MALVDVISGKHGRVGGPQHLGGHGLAVDADPTRVGAELGRENILPATVNTEVSGPNGYVSAASLNESQ
jgi:hypothetical protein